MRIPYIRVWVLGVLLCTSPSARALEQEIELPSSAWHYDDGLAEAEESADPELLYGELTYQDELLPEHLVREGLRLTTDIGTFQFDEEGGWLSVEGPSLDDATTGEGTVTSRELQFGFYHGAFDGRKGGTPDEWVFVEVNGATGELEWTKTDWAYWVGPLSLDALPFEESLDTE